MATIHIQNLRLRTIIGIHDWERKEKQDVVINIWLEYDALKASRSDNIDDTLDYRTLTKDIIQHVENSKYFLLEKLADQILQITLKNPLVKKAEVTVDKPLALRFTDSVSIRLKKSKQ